MRFRGVSSIIGNVGSAPSSRRQSGQAAVEAALTLPLVLFVMLGTLQLFMMFHGRIVTQLAAYRATRAGSVSHGNCNRMTQAAVLQLLPAIHPYLNRSTPGNSPGEKLANAWQSFCGGGNPYGCRNNYGGQITINDGGRSTPATGTIVWIRRRLGGRINIVDASGVGQDTEFDQAPPGANGSSSMRMETELIFWMPMKIPFANWVMAKMIQAYWGLQAYTARNPLMEAGKAMNQNSSGSGWEDPTHAPTLAAAVLSEMTTRMNAGEYVFPITATFGMRMMTPLKRANYNPGAPNCAPTPPSI